MCPEYVLQTFHNREYDASAGPGMFFKGEAYFLTSARPTTAAIATRTKFTLKKSNAKANSELCDSSPMATMFAVSTPEEERSRPGAVHSLFTNPRAPRYRHIPTDPWESWGSPSLHTHSSRTFQLVKGQSRDLEARNLGSVPPRIRDSSCGFRTWGIFATFKMNDFHFVSGQTRYGSKIMRS